MTKLITKTKCINCKKELVHIEDVESGSTWFKNDENYYNPGLSLSFVDNAEEKIRECWFCNEACFDNWLFKQLLKVQNPFVEETR